MKEMPMGSNEEEKKLPVIYGFEFKSPFEHKRESEDAAYVDESKGVLVAADGVSRGPFDNKDEYPHPSPATSAAKIAAAEIGKYLSSIDNVREDEMVKAAMKANNEIRKLNEDLGYWDNTDYLENDLAGTVVAALVRKDKKMIYSFMGDCGAAVIKSSGELTWSTDDEIIPIRPSFPKKEDVGVEERFVRVRRDFRNKPQASHPTYGVLTGEDTAMDYLRVGTIQYELGDTLIVFSDGVTSLVKEDEDFRKLLATGDREQIAGYIQKRSSTEDNSDDKTLLLFRTER